MAATAVESFAEFTVFLSFLLSALVVMVVVGLLSFAGLVTVVIAALLSAPSLVTAIGAPHTGTIDDMRQLNTVSNKTRFTAFNFIYPPDWQHWHLD